MSDCLLQRSANKEVWTVTVLKDFPDPGPLVLAAPVSLHVWENSALVSPEVVLGAKEEDRELADLMAKVLDVGRDISRVVDLCRPPSEEQGRTRYIITSGNKQQKQRQYNTV